MGEIQDKSICIVSFKSPTVELIGYEDSYSPILREIYESTDNMIEEIQVHHLLDEPLYGVS